jgi:3-dehydroquinate dehydratase II
MKVLVLNGPNLNMLEKRDPAVYGNLSLEAIKKLLNEEFSSVSFVFFQSNIDGELINEIQNAATKYDGIIINPGGYAHTSVALHDALEVCRLPKIEVHLSHLGKREEFRQKLLTASACDGYISGFKEYGYMAAVYLLLKLIRK